MPYDLFIHRHNFAVWAAARAVQRGWQGATIQILRESLEASGVQRFLPDPDFLDTSNDRFEQLHRNWCAAIVASLHANAIQNVSYGRAAKLLAVYLKSMVITGSPAYSPIARCIHPPIDRRLLQALAGDSQRQAQNRTAWRRINWTQLNEKKYYTLIEQLRASLPPEIPFWMLEEFWRPTDEED
jgi:hypothetical protein